MKGLEELAAMDETESIPTNTRKKIRKARRVVVGYDAAEPEMCCNCAFFKSSLHASETKEYFPPRCERHKFQVERHAICNYWQDR